MKKKGFTTIELMVSILVIAILATLIFPRFSNEISKSKDARVLSFLANLRSSNVAFESENLGEKAIGIERLSVYIDGTYENITTRGIMSSSVTSIQMKAGIVRKVGVESIGGGKFLGEKNVAEIYYDNTNGKIWIDGTTGSGVNFLDTKGNLWNKY